MHMKIWMLSALALIIAGCSSSVKSAETSAVPSEKTEQKADTMLFVCKETVDNIPYLILRMNPEAAYVSMADSVIPSEADSAIGLCVEAAFTGELGKTFKSTNIGGDYVIEGTFRKGYKCRANIPTAGMSSYPHWGITRRGLRRPGRITAPSFSRFS